MTGSDDYTFECPECAERIEVNEAMKLAIVDSGCVICGAEVTSEDFASCPPEHA